MKNTSILLLFAWSFFRCSSVGAQGVEVLWDSFYYAAGSELLNDLILLPDGQLAGAGELHQKDKPKAGLFVLIDSETGKLKRKYFKNMGNQTLKSIAESNDGSFYLVGQAESQGDKQGWILRLDETGEEIINQKIGEKGNDDRLERIVWLDNGIGLAAGFSEQFQKGSAWVLSLNGNKIDYKDPMGSGRVGNIVGMQQDGQGRVWLAGNLSSSNAKRGGFWLVQLDQNALPKLEEPFIGKSFESLKTMSVSEDGVVMMAGHISTSANLEMDAWVVEYDADLKVPKTDKQFEYEGDDHANAILKTSDHQRWMASRNGKGGTSIVTWGNDGIAEIARNFVNEAEFKPISLIKTWQGTYIVAGVAKDPRGRREGIRVICFKNNETLAAKAFLQVEIECKESVFMDANSDGYLSPNERASLNLRLRNVGEVDIDAGQARILVLKGNVVQGFTVLKESLYLPFLTANGSARGCAIPIKGEAGLRAGASDFQVVVEVRGKQVLKMPFVVQSIESNQARHGKRANIIVTEPKLLGSERKVSVSDKTYKVKATIANSRKTKAEDIDISVGNTIQQDQRSPRKLESIADEGDQFTYEYTAIISLDSGTNVVRLSLDDYTTDSIVFEVSDAHPDLHILAIGPSYPNLKYTENDARALAGAFARQSGKGFFGQVFLDTLIGPVDAKKTPIETAFNKLLLRSNSSSLPNRIKPNDYVFVIYSGHGIKIDNRFFMVPSDYVADADIATTIDYKKMLDEYLNKIKCKKVVFLDACLSGSAKSSVADLTLAEAINEANSSNPGLVCFSSCSENELSFEDDAWGNGAFTEALLEAIDGKALGIVPRRGEKAAPISAGILYDFLSKRVKELVEGKGKGKSQTPSLKLNDSKETLTIFAIPSN